MEGGIALDNKNVPRNLPGPPGNKSVVQKVAEALLVRLYWGGALSMSQPLFVMRKVVERASFLRNLLSFS